MDITKFEEKVAEVVKKNSLYVPFDEETEDNFSHWVAEYTSYYKHKTIHFFMRGKNNFNFTLSGTDWSILKQAINVLKNMKNKKEIKGEE